jgi:hypothetical protein
MRPVNVEIVPKLETLHGLQLSRSDFDGALELALEKLSETPTNQLPAPRNIALVVGGHEYRLGDLATIDVSFGADQATISV